VIRRNILGKLISTLGLSYEEWLKYRKMGIGGSDAGAICGLNPYSTAISVFKDKTSDEVTQYDNEAMRQGRDLEDYVAKRFTEETGLKVRKANAIFINENSPFMLANVDRMIVGKNIGLECKTTTILNADKWKDGDIPPHYQIQCYHYMAVTNAEAWYIAVVILGKEFKYVKIDRDEEIIQNLISIEEKFWSNHIVKNIMPNPDGSKIADEILNQYYNKARKDISIQLSGFDDKFKRRDELIELLNKMEKEKKEIEQEIKIAMADAETAICNKYRVNWKNISTSKVDIERIKLERPDIYKRYIKEVNSRRFIIKTA
jgi:putative phage-type endonuclease